MSESFLSQVRRLCVWLWGTLFLRLLGNSCLVFQAFFFQASAFVNPAKNGSKRREERREILCMHSRNQRWVVGRTWDQKHDGRVVATHPKLIFSPHNRCSTLSHKNSCEYCARFLPNHTKRGRQVALLESLNVKKMPLSPQWKPHILPQKEHGCW